MSRRAAAASAASLAAGPSRARAAAVPRRLPPRPVPSCSSPRHLSSSAGGSSSSSSSPTSRDPASEAHFSKLSSTWWSPSGELGLLHAMNPVRVKWVLDKLRAVDAWDASLREVREGKKAARGDEPEERGLRGRETLDVGCGGGLLTESLARLGARAHGIDATASNIPMALHHASQDPSLPLVGVGEVAPATGASLSYEHTTAEDLLRRRRAELGAGNEGYDVVCAMEVIEHVAGPGDFLRSLAQLVKPGGHLFLSTIARTPLSYFLTILVAEDVLGLVSKGTHTHSQYINPTELDAFFTHDVPWLALPRGAVRDEFEARTPRKMRTETRGVAYVPWRGAWQLSPDWAKEWKTEQGNYFYYVRRPLEDA